MRKALVSFGFDSHRELLSVAIPTFHIYAYNFGYDLVIPNKEFFSDHTKTRPYSWWKLEIIKHVLQTYDFVLWIDSDVIISRFDKDIQSDISNECDTGFVIHHTPDGYVPNCGVWPLYKQSLRWIDELWQYDKFNRSNCWWEQAAMLHILGINPDTTPLAKPAAENYLGIKWIELDYVWNPHINDSRKIPHDARFIHTTCLDNKNGVMKTILAQVLSS